MADSDNRRNLRKNEELNKKSYEKEEAERRMRAKRKRKKRMRRRRIVTFLFVILLILCVLLVFIKTPLFDIENISIEGNSFVSTEEIINASGIAEGENIFTHGKGYIEEKIISLPYISKAEVRKKYPSKVYITVYEETEFAALDFEGEWIACDRNGKAIRNLKEEEKNEFIVVKGCNKGEFELGGYVVLSTEDETETLRKCLSVIRDYGFSDVTEVDMSDAYNITFTVGGNLTVKIGEFGDEDELSYKMAYIKEVINNLPQKISGIIDATNIESGVSYRTGEFSYEPETEVEENSDGENKDTSDIDNGGEVIQENTEEISE